MVRDEGAANEEWRSVVGYEGLYEVSNFGRVRNPRKVLAAGVNGVGYPNVRLRGAVGGFETKLVHAIVLEAFVGARPEGMQACHNNGVRNDNRLENLRWDTVSANRLDTLKHGTHPQANKTHCPRGHPLEEPNLVVSIRKEGRRACLACQRARSYVTLYPDKDFKKESDRYYQSIMEER